MIILFKGQSGFNSNHEKILVLTFLLISVIQRGLSQSQKTETIESIVINSFKKINGRLGPSVIYLDTLIENGAFLILNNGLVKNKNQISLFFIQYRNKCKGLKYYPKDEGNKKWKILNDAGYLYVG